MTVEIVAVRRKYFEASQCDFCSEWRASVPLLALKLFDIVFLLELQLDILGSE
jgi:hypothetical protein